jgi:hypothetical protein
MNENDLFLEYEKCKAENTELVRQVLELESYIERILIPTNKITNHILIEPINEHLKKDLNESFKLTDSLNKKLQQSQKEIETLRKVVAVQSDALKLADAIMLKNSVYVQDIKEFHNLLKQTKGEE